MIISVDDKFADSPVFNQNFSDNFFILSARYIKKHSCEKSQPAAAVREFGIIG